MNKLFCLQLIFLIFSQTKTFAALPLESNLDGGLQIESNIRNLPKLAHADQTAPSQFCSSARNKEEPDNKSKKVKPTEGFAIATFIVGLISLFIPGLLLSLTVGTLAIALGVSSIYYIGDGQKRGGKGIAIAGLVLGFISMIAVGVKKLIST